MTVMYVLHCQLFHSYFCNLSKLVHLINITYIYIYIYRWGSLFWSILRLVIMWTSWLHFCCLGVHVCVCVRPGLGVFVGGVLPVSDAQVQSTENGRIKMARTIYLTWQTVAHSVFTETKVATMLLWNQCIYYQCYVWGSGRLLTSHDDGDGGILACYLFNAVMAGETLCC